ncbi:2,3-diketo-L-gulonate TRAP transporter small permease protein YiaM [Variovorax sp. PBS-H4]|uniref:TRAP transporter small permease n=1 Tax=Variovorax sp. PBS-H4 TaxID=434008 RepID=UPI0013185C7C|nr:TRAP transporter small permease [Variovorax sp. PBS-H4]VTU38737.1 2,3-diketo-L-gulonate TRAP transporter small permease protein YiaM [Variovorax sp. PBS-H4]
MDPLFVRACDRLYLACIWLAGFAIFLMSLIIPWGVFTRYVLGTGSQWPEPVAILFMMVFTFIGAAAAYRAGAHIAVSMITDLLREPLKKALAVLVDLLMIVVCAFVAYYGTRLCMETWHQSISELPWLPVGVTYAALPAGSAVTLVFVIERMACGSQAHRNVVRYEEGADAPEGAR